MHTLVLENTIDFKRKHGIFAWSKNYYPDFGKQKNDESLLTFLMALLFLNFWNLKIHIFFQKLLADKLDMALSKNYY